VCESKNFVISLTSFFNRIIEEVGANSWKISIR